MQPGRQRLLTWGDGVLGAALLVFLLVLLLRRLDVHQAALLRQLQRPKAGLVSRGRGPLPAGTAAGTCSAQYSRGVKMRGGPPPRSLRASHAPSHPGAHTGPPLPHLTRGHAQGLPTVPHPQEGMRRASPCPTSPGGHARASPLSHLPRRARTGPVCRRKPASMVPVMGLKEPPRIGGFSMRERRLLLSWEPGRSIIPGRSGRKLLSFSFTFFPQNLL